jgi:hypothetical protein
MVRPKPASASENIFWQPIIPMPSGISLTPMSSRKVRADGDPTGELPVPVVTIHSINDPAAVVEQESTFRDVVRAAGSGDRLVQAFTDEHAHVGLSAPEVGAALDALMRWIETGAKPTPQSIATACEELRASLDAPCTYHPARSHSTRASIHAKSPSVKRSIIRGCADKSESNPQSPVRVIKTHPGMSAASAACCRPRDHAKAEEGGPDLGAEGLGEEIGGHAQSDRAHSPYLAATRSKFT